MSGSAIGVGLDSEGVPAEPMGGDVYLVPWRALWQASWPWRVDGRPIRALTAHAQRDELVYVTPGDAELLAEYGEPVWDVRELGA